MGGGGQSALSAATRSPADAGAERRRIPEHVEGFRSLGSRLGGHSCARVPRTAGPRPRIPRGTGEKRKDDPRGARVFRRTRNHHFRRAGVHRTLYRLCPYPPWRRSPDPDGNRVSGTAPHRSSAQHIRGVADHLSSVHVLRAHRSDAGPLARQSRPDDRAVL